MAITKLMHMKESPGTPHTHLRNAINYVLDVKHFGEKTGYGRYVGGNAGTHAGEILDTFLETKQEFGKLDRRQGYHFVLSFAKGETDADTAFSVAKQFCEEYLGDNYDYVFAVHTDKEHLHAHIIFNSVSRVDGLKYHYTKGDWEKYIQPVTDKVCMDHGLAPLTFEEERVGVSYASWAGAQEGRINWSHIIRADVDFAVHQSGSFEEFCNIMKKMNYRLRFGQSKKHGAYITYTFVDQNGKEHRRRSYNLPPGYAPEELAERLRTKSGPESYAEVAERVAGRAGDYVEKFASLTGTQAYRRIYQSVNYYRLPNPYAVPAYRVRRDMLRIDRLLEECNYLKEKRITDAAGLKAAELRVDQTIDRLIRERKTLYGVMDTATEEQKERMEEYGALQREWNRAVREGDDRFEEIEDRMKEMEEALPHDLLEAAGRLEACSRRLKEARKEKRILERIRQTEGTGDWQKKAVEPEMKP